MAAALIWFFVPATPPKVLGITQITHDGYPTGNMLTDGARVYVTQWRPEGLVLEQVSTTGGETSSCSVADEEHVDGRYLPRPFPTAGQHDASHRKQRKRDASTQDIYALDVGLP